MLVPSIITDIKGSLQQVLIALQNRLTLNENVLCAQITVTTPDVADTEFTVTHALGKTPTQYIANLDVAGIVYDSNRASWTTNLIYLKCSAASANLTITVF